MKTIAQKVGLKVVYTNHTQFTTFAKDIRIEPVKVAENNQTKAQNNVDDKNTEQNTEQNIEQIVEQLDMQIKDHYDEEKENDEAENI